MELNNVFWLLGIFVVVVVLFGVGSCRFMENSSEQDDDRVRK